MDSGRLAPGIGMTPAERRPPGDSEVRVAVVQVDAPQQRVAGQLPCGQLDSGERNRLAMAVAAARSPVRRVGQHHEADDAPDPDDQAGLA